MSITTRLVATLATPALLLITSITSTSAHAVGIPGSSIPESGVPIFQNEVSVRANHGSWTISGKDGFSFYDGSTLWNGSNGQYRLKATFDDAGNLVSGTLSIKGKIAGLTDVGKGNGPETLVTADLIDFDFDALYDDRLIGFATDNIICSPLLGVSCTNSESVWVQLDNVYGDDPNARFKNSGTAYTTVPLPAAVWLFGSGLGILGAAGKARRRKIARI